MMTTQLSASSSIRIGALAVASLGLLGGGLLLAPSATAAHPMPRATATAAPSADPSLTATLTFNHEEERMARDLYQLFASTYDDARPFTMIVRSEQQHMDAVARLMSTYGIPVPSGTVPGTYDDPALQKLYEAWSTQGLASYDEALKVGAALERRDIADLEAAVASTSEQAVKDVLGRLLSASRNHLRAFESTLAGADHTGPLGSSAASQAPGRGQGTSADGPGMRQHRQGMADADGDGNCDVTGQPIPTAGSGPRTSTTKPAQGLGKGQGMGMGPQGRR